MKRRFGSCHGTLSPLSRGQRQKKKEGNIPQTEKQQDIIFFLSSWGGGAGWGAGLHSLYTGLLRKCGRSQTVPTSGSVWHGQTSCPFGAAPEGNIHAVREGGARLPPPRLRLHRGLSRSPRKRWPSCPLSPSRCTCRPWRCRSSAPTRTPWTGGDGEKKKKRRVRFQRRVCS